jgi:hypothetical protein
MVYDVRLGRGFFQLRRGEVTLRGERISCLNLFQYPEVIVRDMTHVPLAVEAFSCSMTDLGMQRRVLIVEIRWDMKPE